MKGDEVIARGDIVITDNRITAIGPSGKVQIPAGAVVRNLSGKTIMPGLVDIHAHTWVAWGVHRSQVSQFLAQLAFGVTTQRDPQTSSEDALTYQDLMETGQLIGPRLYSTGPGIFAADNIRSLDEARDVVRRYSDHYNTQDDQAVHGRRPQGAAVGDHGGEGARPHADDRRRIELHHEPDADAGRLRRPRALAADQSVLQRRGQARRRQRDHLHADA